MIDVQGIEKTPIYKTCFLRRNIIRLIQREVSKPDYVPSSPDVESLNGLLVILNSELKSMNKRNLQ